MDEHHFPTLALPIQVQRVSRFHAELSALLRTPLVKRLFKIPRMPLYAAGIRSQLPLWEECRILNVEFSSLEVGTRNSTDSVFDTQD